MPNFNIYLIVYIIIACFVTIKYTHTLYQSGDTVTAFFFLLGPPSSLFCTDYDGLQKINRCCPILRSLGHLLLIPVLTI